MDVIRVAKVDGVVCSKPGHIRTGTLHLTAHHLIFNTNNNEVDQEMWVPYPIIGFVTRMPQTLQGSNPLAFRCRNFENFSLFFSKEQDAVDVFESVKELTVITSVTQLYAFIYEPNPPLSTANGWSLYSPQEEFARMGVGTRTKAWRFTDINKDYTFCPTYPAQFVVPTKISDATLQYAVKYRSRGRIPALTYLHWANYGSITRSSQPMVGLTNNRSAQDEKLIEAIFQSHYNPMNPHAEAKVYGATATNLITDARPTANAMATYAKGAGTENMEYYRDAKKVYLGVDNIHAMRDSLVKVVDALREADANAAILQTMDPTRPIPSEGIFLDRNALRRSGWLGYISALLEGTVIVVRNIHINSSHVLIHCSDGWDRTAQLSSLAQICLDPFFRTIKGFQILIEKDWLSFGYRFLDRCGHLSSEKFFLSTYPGDGGNADISQTFLASMQNRFTPRHHIKETSPVFHQFLESVRQIQRQFPKRFEYNQRFLERLHYHLYSCQFGTFLHNNEKERRLASDGGKPHWELTVSAWDWFNTAQEMEKNQNPDYDPSLDDPKSGDMGVLFPNPKDVRFWHELYGRSDEEMNGRTVNTTEVTSSVEALSLTDSSEEEPAAVSVAQSPSTPELITSELPPDSDATRDSWSSLPSAPTNKIERPSTPKRDSHRAYNPVKSTNYLHNNADAGPSTGTSRSPRRHGSPLPRFPEALTSGGFKSMWGKLSSNASAAFLNVRDAYEGVTKDLITGNQSTPDLTGGEMQSADSSGSPWSLRTPRATTGLEVEANPWASAAQEPPRSQESLGSHLPLDPNIPSTLRFNTMPSHPTTSLSRSSSSHRHSILPAPLNRTGNTDIPSESELSLPTVSDRPARQQADPLGASWL